MESIFLFDITHARKRWTGLNECEKNAQYIV